MNLLIFFSIVFATIVFAIVLQRIIHCPILVGFAFFAAFFVSEYSEAIAVMLLYQIGELFQRIAVDKSRKSIADLMDICPEYANVLTGENLSDYEEIDSDEVETEIEFDFDVDKVLDEEINGELEIFCRLIYEEKDLASKSDSKLIVRAEGVRR